MIEIRELIIKTKIENRNNNSSPNELNPQIILSMKKEILEDSMEHFSKVLKNKKER